MNTEVHDVRLQTFLKKKIREMPLNHQIALKNLKTCGARVMVDNHGRSSGVFLLQSNQGRAKFWGARMCKSPWACPVCTAKRMNEYSRDIACAIDALRDKGYKANMITLTIPNYKFMSCVALTEILYNSWKRFMIHSSCNSKTKFQYDIVNRFLKEFDCKHRVRVTEYTYNKFFGWHPHFHALFWYRADKLQNIADWEQKLRDKWESVVLLEFKKYYAKNPITIPEPFAEHKDIESLIKFAFDYNRQNKSQKKTYSLYFSKTETGKIREALTSDYIAGWGADREVTGNRSRKASSKNSFTPYKLLEAAYSNCEGADEFFNLFVEYAVATKLHRHARVNFSVHSGLKKIIADYKRSQKYQECIKKKFSTEKWAVLIWFPSELWSKICEIDSDHFIIARMLAIARKYDYMKAWDIIYELLLSHGVNIDGWFASDWHMELADKMFNRAS